MNATQQAATFNGILSSLEVSDSEREFLDQVIQVAPQTMSSGRNLTAVTIRLFEEFELNVFESEKRIVSLIERKVLYRRKNKPTIGFFEFKAKPKKKRGRCVYCRQMTSQATKDHVIPKQQGGPDIAANIVIACRHCNFAKGNRTPQQWALDVLRYDQPSKPKPIGLTGHLKIAVVLLVSFFVQIGGAK
jgi:hypothetical protein